MFIVLLFLILNLFIFLFTLVNYIHLDHKSVNIENDTRNIISIAYLSFSLLGTIICTILYFLTKYSIFNHDINSILSLISIVLSLISSFVSWDFFTRASQLNERSTITTVIIVIIILCLITQTYKTKESVP